MTDIGLRLKGNSSWTQAVQDDPHPKMQFVISFNEINKKNRFMGVDKLDLDMPRSDASFMRQRLALHYLRSIGQPALCANNATITFNGKFYGLYTNMEHEDSAFLTRMFPGEDSGDLWKGGRDIKNNTKTYTWLHLDDFWNATTVDELSKVLDIDDSIKEWASEAVMPDDDGYFMGKPNYMLYDHPTKGFIFLENDLDSGFDFIPTQLDPLHPDCGGCSILNRQQYAMVLNYKSWEDKYVEQLHMFRDGYDPAEMMDSVQSWAGQIQDASVSDLMKPFTDLAHDEAVTSLASFPTARAEYLDKWFECRNSGGEDADNDGFPWCFDCDDHNANIHPGAGEVCNGKDDDCNFLIDDGRVCAGLYHL